MPTVTSHEAIRARILQGHEPAFTTVIAQTIDPGWLIEIEAIAAA